jgi:ElaB/YqjD/DUF883 family membrane-anchored ribosome-binding protein
MKNEEMLTELKKLLDEELKEYFPEGKKKLTEARDSLSDYVTEHPLQSVAVAFLAGVLVSKLFQGSGRER